MGMWRCPAQDPSSPIQGRNNVTVATFGPNLETLNVIISEQLIHFSNTSSCSGRPHWRWNVFSRYLVNVPHLPDLAEAELTSCFSHIAIELFALWLHISYMTWLKMLFWFLAIDFYLFFLHKSSRKLTEVVIKSLRFFFCQLKRQLACSPRPSIALLLIRHWSHHLIKAAWWSRCERPLQMKEPLRMTTTTSVWAPHLLSPWPKRQLRFWLTRRLIRIVI